MKSYGLGGVVGSGEGIFRPFIFENSQFFFRKRSIYGRVGIFAPLPWEIGLSLIPARLNPIPTGLFEGFFVLTHAYEDDT